MSNEINVDQLYSEAMEGVSSEIPMTAEPEEATQEAAAPVPQEVPELEFDYKGKIIKSKFDDPRVKQWASQGYDYAQRVSELKKQQEEFDSKYKSDYEKLKPAQELNDWATQNPEKWKSLYESWSKSIQEGTPQAQLPPEILQKLEKYDQVIKKIEEKEHTEKIQLEDSEVDAEVKSVQKQYPNLDFTAPVHDGQSLEYKILEYGTKRGIKSFADAFYAYNHKNLFKIAEEKGKEAVDKDIQKKSKLGLLGKTPAPTKGLRVAENVQSKTYEDLLKEAQDEFNL